MAYIPTPSHLDDAPELAVLAVLEPALEATTSAVIAMHPELRSGCSLDDQLPRNPAVWVAYDLTERARALRDAIRRYRIALAIPCPRCPTCNTPLKER